MVVEDEKQLDKVLAVRSELPHLKAIVQYLGVPKKEGVLSWEELLQIGVKEGDEELEERLGREGSARDHGARVGTRTGSSGVRTHLTMSAVGWVGVGRRNGFGRTPCPGGLSRVKSGLRHQGMGTRHVTVGNPRRPL